jgi:hypothetical protein
MSRPRHFAKALAGVRPGTVLDHYTEKYGVHKGAIRAAHMAQIALVVLEEGRDFSNRQYCEHWGCTERTGWLHRAEAEEVYGERWRDVAYALAEEVERRRIRAPGKVARLAFRTG